MNDPAIQTQRQASLPFDRGARETRPMRLYIDDDSVDPGLIRLLRRDGHDVQIPADAGLVGSSDQVHLAHAIRHRRAILTRNYRGLRSPARSGRLRRERSSRRHSGGSIRQQSAEQHVRGRHRSRRAQSGECRRRDRRLVFRVEPLAISPRPRSGASPACCQARFRTRETGITAPDRSPSSRAGSRVGSGTSSFRTSTRWRTDRPGRRPVVRNQPVGSRMNRAALFLSSICMAYPSFSRKPARSV